jgi:iron complex transport system substrate-binding protein
VRRRTLLRIASAAAAAPLVSTAAGQAAFVDDAGRAVPLRGAPRRVFPAGAPASVFVYCLAPDRLLGWTRALRPDEAAFLLPSVASLPELGRLTGRGSTAKLEAVLATGADLVLDVGSTDATYASLADQVARQTGVPYALIDGDFDRTAQSLRRLGRLLSVEERAEQLARMQTSVIDEAREVSAAVPRSAAPRVYFARGPSGLTTSASGGLNAEVIDAVGAVNVAALPVRNLAQVSYEQVLMWNPDWIVATDPGFFAGVARHPFWSGLPAVRQRRVLLAPKLPFGWFDSPPALNRVLGVVWLLAALYPERVRFALDERVRDLHRTLYHRDPTIERVRALLSASRLAAS